LQPMLKQAVLLLSLTAATLAFAPSQRSSHAPNVAPNFSTRPKAVNTAAADHVSLAVEYATKLTGVDGWRVSSNYSTQHNGIVHVHLRQYISDLPVLNAESNVNILPSGEVLTFGESAHKNAIPSKFLRTPAPGLSALEAVKAAAPALGLSALGIDAREVTKGQFAITARTLLEPAMAKLGLVRTNGQEGLVLVWSVTIKTNDEWYDAWLDAESGAVVARNSWVADNTYNVYYPPTNDPDDGARSLVDHPQDKTASTLGWHDQDSGKTFDTTIGNNVFAQDNRNGGSEWRDNYRPQVSSDLDFDFVIDFKKEPETYENASITNLFVLSNVIHDVFYLYGFDEQSGNFQETNLDRGGLGDDAVQANAQDGSGYNNANFATPPDGQRPRMRMYLWNSFTPMRDGDFENGIVIHEYGHGISNRLTGGPENSNCLGFGQSGGMGEGWSDWFSLVFRQREEYTNKTVFPMGDYVAPGGIRPYPYSTDMNTDPQTFDFLNQAGYSGVHAIGSVWCTMLWDVYWNVVDMSGWDPDLYRGEGGNNMVRPQYLLDTLQLWHGSEFVVSADTLTDPPQRCRRDEAPALPPHLHRRPVHTRALSHPRAMRMCDSSTATPSSPPTAPTTTASTSAPCGR